MDCEKFTYLSSDGNKYTQIVPKYICVGNHARFIKPIFDEVCIGTNGIDIGYGKSEWRIRRNCYYANIDDLNNINGEIIQYVDNNDNIISNINNNTFDWIFSSHCLEHIPRYMDALKYWVNNLKVGGIFFLYLPHPNCIYWRPHYMTTRRHIHMFYPEEMKERHDGK